MKKTIHARIVAKAISFPDQVEIQCHPVDKSGNPVGTSMYRSGPYTWEQVKRRLLIDEPYALECEVFFAKGCSALIRNASDIEGDWIEPGDDNYVEPEGGPADS